MPKPTPRPMLPCPTGAFGPPHARIRLGKSGSNFRVIGAIGSFTMSTILFRTGQATYDQVLPEDEHPLRLISICKPTSEGTP